MNSKDDLHQLIHSLTRMEKRGFSTRAKRSSDDKSNYYRLFEALNGMDSYDEEKLKRKFKGEKLLKNLAKEKKYLLDIILKFMRSHRNDKAITVQIKEKLMDADFLYEKGLYNMALRNLHSAKKQAYEYEHYTSILEILRQERSILSQTREKKYHTSLKEIWEEKEKIVGVLKERNAYDCILDHEIIIIGSDFTPKKEKVDALKMLIDSPIMQEDAPRNSFISKYRFHQINALYYHTIGDYKKAQSLYLKVIKCWQEYPHLQKEHLSLYCGQVTNFIETCVLAEDHEPISDMLELLKNVETKNHQAKGLLFSFSSHSEFRLYINLGRFKEAEALLPEIEEGLKKYRDVIGKSRILSFMMNIAAFYFVMGNTEKTTFWCDAVIKEGSSGLREDLQRFARTLKLILFYDAGKIDELENYYRSVKRFFSKNSEGELEKLAYKYVKEILK